MCNDLNKKNNEQGQELSDNDSQFLMKESGLGLNVINGKKTVGKRLAGADELKEKIKQMQKDDPSFIVGFVRDVLPGL